MGVQADATIDGIAAALQRASRVVVMTGAGISAESGIPTFREAQSGLWARFRPEELATEEAFERDPTMVWRWYEWRRQLIREAVPNPGHRALAELGASLPGLTLVTQNVDGLHQRAGNRDVIELHGNINRSICHRTRRPIDDSWLADATGEPPASPHAADGLARPDVVWFGEALPAAAFRTATDRSAACELFFSIGTSAVVEPAASLGRLAAGAGADVIEINPAPTPLTSQARWVLRAPAGEALPAIIERLAAT